MNVNVDLKELRAQSIAELKQLVMQLREQQFYLKMQQQLRQLKKVSQLRNVRRDIARIKTIITEKVCIDEQGN